MSKPLQGGFLVIEIDEYEEWVALQVPQPGACRATDPAEHEGHVYPGDWIFGGPNDTDPAADPRWKPTSYTYWSEDFKTVWVTSVPHCDEEAYDNFTWVRDTFRCRPKFISARRPDGAQVMLKVHYNSDTDEVNDVEG